MTFNFLGPGLTVNVEAKVKEQIILDSSDPFLKKCHSQVLQQSLKDLELAYINFFEKRSNFPIQEKVSA